MWTITEPIDNHELILQIFLTFCYSIYYFSTLPFLSQNYCWSSWYFFHIECHYRAWVMSKAIYRVRHLQITEVIGGAISTWANPEGAEAFLWCNVYGVRSPYPNLTGEKLKDVSDFLNIIGLWYWWKSRRCWYQIVCQLLFASVNHVMISFLFILVQINPNPFPPSWIWYRDCYPYSPCPRRNFNLLAKVASLAKILRRQIKLSERMWCADTGVSKRKNNQCRPLETSIRDWEGALARPCRQIHGLNQAQEASRRIPWPANIYSQSLLRHTKQILHWVSRPGWMVNSIPFPACP